MECTCSEISFWRDPHRVGVQPDCRPKYQTRLPRAVKNLFSFLSMDFGWNFIRKHEKSIFDPTLRLCISANIYRISWNRVSEHSIGIKTPHNVAKMPATFSIRCIGKNSQNRLWNDFEILKIWSLDFASFGCQGDSSVRGQVRNEKLVSKARRRDWNLYSGG